jgi:hypothetical protein
VRPWLHLFSALLVSASALALAVRLYVGRRGSDGAEGARPLATVGSPLRELQTATHLVRLRAAAEVYRLERGAYPPALAELVAADYLPSTALGWPSYRETYYYRPVAEGLVLLPPKR